MADFRPILVALLLSGLFAIAFIFGAEMMASQNNAVNNINSDPQIGNYSQQIQSTLQSSSTDANTAESAVGNSTITLTSQGIIIDAISGIWKTLQAASITVYSLTIGFLLVNINNSPQFALVTGTIAAILTITIVFAVWKSVRTGDSG